MFSQSSFTRTKVFIGRIPIPVDKRLDEDGERGKEGSKLVNIIRR